MKQNRIYIYGKHAVEEALRYAPQALTKVYLDSKADPKLRAVLQKSTVSVAKLSEGLARADLKSGTSHQGVVGQLSIPQLMVPYSHFAERLAPSPSTSLVLLAGLEDPHNVGAIIRSAAAFGAAAVVMPEHGQAPITGAVAKASAGAAFRIPLVQTLDLLQTIADLKKRGFRIYGLAGDAAGAVSLEQEAFNAPAVFMLGNEGAGLPPHLRERCDAMLSIPTSNRVESLNVAAAAAAALFAWSSRHQEALKN